MVDAYALYVDHTRGAGTDLYQLAYRFDLEGIVAKRADSLYDDHATTATWIQIVNPGYSQKVGRGELFTRAGKTGFPEGAQAWVAPSVPQLSAVLFLNSLIVSSGV